MSDVSQSPAPKSSLPPWKKYPLIILGTAFGTGYSPVASGTAGTFPAVGVFILISLCAGPSEAPWLIAAALAVSCVLSVILGNWAEAHWGRKDPGTFVLDEVAGYLLTVLLFRGPSLPLTILWTFLATRAMDIIKIPPARQLEHLPGGWGILLDDLFCSLYAAGLLHLARLIWPSFAG